MPSIMPVRGPNKEPSTAPVFGYSSGYPIEILSYNPTKDPYPFPIIKPPIVPSETPIKDTYHVSKWLPSANSRNMSIEPSNEYTIDNPSTMPTEKPSLNPRSYPISYQYALKRGIQESHVGLQINIMLFIFNII